MAMVELICKRCGKTYKRVSTRAHQSSYCSKECSRTTVKLVCQRCGKAYERPARLAENSKYCSKLCVPLNKFTCKVCGKEYERLPSHGPSSYCSRECQMSEFGGHNKKQKVAKKCRICGKAFEVLPSRAKTSRYCSPECGNEAKRQHFKGRPYSSEIITCGHCGKRFREYKSRVGRYGINYCSHRCYMESKSSGLERIVATWMTEHGIDFTTQVFFSNSIMDFKIGDVFVEVHGCYWHGCPKCHPEQTKRQERRRKRDGEIMERAKAAGLEIVIIWGHEIEAGDFSTLSRFVPV